jgi:excisionase family DNA binding protein
MIERHSGTPNITLALLTFKEAMEFLRVSRSTIYRLMWAGQLRGYKVGNTWRFYEQDLLAAVAVPMMQPTMDRDNHKREG